MPSGVAVVVASAKLWFIGAVQAVIFAGKEFIRMMRAVSAGFTKFCPMPPNICLTTTIAITPPNAAMIGLMETGRFIASKTPVTTQERSPTVCGRFMTRRETYSLKIHAATVVRMMTAARKPKRITEAIMAGVSAMMTSSMRVCVVSFAWKCGDEETISLFISSHSPS